MAVLLPSWPPPSDATMSLVRAGNDLPSSLGGPTQRIIRLGDRWRMNVQLPPLPRVKAEEWIADLIDSFNSTVAYPYPQIEGGIGNPGTPRVNGASQAGSVLITDGWTPGYVIRKGLMFSILSGGIRYLHQVKAAVTANGSGQATLNINPMLRKSPANNDLLEFTQPYIEGLIGNDEGAWRFQAANYIGLQFSITENR